MIPHTDFQYRCDLENHLRDRFFETATDFARHIGYKTENSDTIYRLMKSLGIGESHIGKAMDSAKRGGLHRLKGHHFLYDFPINRPEEIPGFIAHLFSDAFTKQGLPIFPGEMIDLLPQDLARSFGLKVAQNNLNWGFINGFDVIAGLSAGYFAMKNFEAAYNGELRVDDAFDLTVRLAGGFIQAVVAVKSANPLLLASALTDIGATFIAATNDYDEIFLRRLVLQFTVKTMLVGTAVEECIADCTVEALLSGTTVEETIADCTVESLLRRIG